MKFIHNIIPKAYFFILPLTIMVPNWTVIDIKGMLWLYMSILNTFLLVYIFLFRKEFNFKIFEEKMFLSFFIFFITSLLSVFFAINKQESIMRITDYYCILSSLFIVFYIIKNKLVNTLTILNIVLFTLVLDILGSYFQLYQVYQFYDYFILEHGGEIKSFYPNKNVASFILIVKTFIVLIIPYYSKNKLLKVFIGIIVCLTLYVLLLLSTRSVLILLPITILGIVFLLSIKFFLYKSSIIKSIMDFKYFILPLFISYLLFNISLNDKTNVKINDRVNSVLNSDDESVNNRIRFYSHAISQIKKTPIFGIGVGNWRIKSIEYDREDMFSYVVPYSVHNDFLEVFVENGIFGFISFVLFFFFLFKKIIKMAVYYIKENINFGSLYLLMGFLMIMGDFNLNFPLDRPSSIITYILFISISYSIYFNDYEKI